MPFPVWVSKFRKDEERWDEAPIVDATLTADIINAWIVSRLEVWEEESIRDEDLWIEYQQDFKGWTADIFKKVSKDLARLLRDRLRIWGVYITTRKGSTIVEQLVALLDEEEPIAWTDEAFQKLFDNKEVYSRGLKRMHQRQQISRPTGQEGTDQSYPTQTGSANPLANNREILPRSGSAMTDTYRQNTDSTDLQQRQMPTPVSTDSVPSNTGFLQSQNDGVYHPNLYQPGSAPPRDISKALTDLSKLYSDDRLKFRGDKY